MRQRPAAAPPSGLDTVRELLTAPPCAFVFGPSPNPPAVGSEEARSRASLRPPPKLDVQFSRIQLSRRCVPLGGKRRNQSNKVHQAQLAIQFGHGQTAPAGTSPMLAAMRPQSPHDPAVESVEEQSDVGALVVVPPPAQQWIQPLNQFRGSQRQTGNRAAQLEIVKQMSRH